MTYDLETLKELRRKVTDVIHFRDYLDKEIENLEPKFKDVKYTVVIKYEPPMDIDGEKTYVCIFKKSVKINADAKNVYIDGNCLKYELGGLGLTHALGDTFHTYELIRD